MRINFIDIYNTSNNWEKYYIAEAKVCLIQFIHIKQNQQHLCHTKISSKVFQYDLFFKKSFWYLNT